MSTPFQFSQTLARVRAYYDSRKRQEELEESAVWTYVYRPISFYLTVPLVWARISANQVTLLGFIVALVGLVFLATGSYANTIIGAVCILLFVLLDHCDGNVARYWQTASDYGRLIDGVVDNVVYGFLSFFIGLGLSIKAVNQADQYSNPSTEWVLGWCVLGAAASCCHFLRIYLPELVNNMTGSPEALVMSDKYDNIIASSDGTTNLLQKAIYVARNVVHTLPILLVILAIVDWLWPLLVILSVARFVALGISVFRVFSKARRLLG